MQQRRGGSLNCRLAAGDGCQWHVVRPGMQQQAREAWHMPVGSPPAACLLWFDAISGSAWTTQAGGPGAMHTSLGASLCKLLPATVHSGLCLPAEQASSRQRL